MLPYTVHPIKTKLFRVGSAFSKVSEKIVLKGILQNLRTSRPPIFVTANLIFVYYVMNCPFMFDPPFEIEEFYCFTNVRDTLFYIHINM